MKASENGTTTALTKLAKKGDREAFLTLINQNKQPLYRTAKAILRSDADVADAIQETILSCWQTIGSLREDAYFKTWLTRILINKCKDIIRQNQGMVLSAEMPEGTSNGELSEERMLIRDIFAQMEDTTRWILILYFIDGFTSREIAETLDMNENTVKTRISRGREQFKQTYTTVQKGGCICEQ